MIIFRVLVTFPIFMFFLMIFQLITPVLLTATNYCFPDILLLLTYWGGLTNLCQTWYGVQWFFCVTIGGSHSLIQPFTKIWCTPNLPLCCLIPNQLIVNSWMIVILFHRNCLMSQSWAGRELLYIHYMYIFPNFP